MYAVHSACAEGTGVCEQYIDRRGVRETREKQPTCGAGVVAGNERGRASAGCVALFYERHSVRSSFLSNV